MVKHRNDLRELGLSLCRELLGSSACGRRMYTEPRTAEGLEKSVAEQADTIDRGPSFAAERTTPATELRYAAGLRTGLALLHRFAARRALVALGRSRRHASSQVDLANTLAMERAVGGSLSAAAQPVRPETSGAIFGSGSCALPVGGATFWPGIDVR